MQALITDWLMIIITAIYVVATCIICVFNARTANIAQKQLEETRAQYVEEKKYRVLPWLHITIDSLRQLGTDLSGVELISPFYCDEKDVYHLPYYKSALCIKNIGLGTATRVSYNWNCPDGLCSIPALYVNKALMSGDSIIAEFVLESVIPSAVKLGHKDMYTSAALEFEFFDIYSRSYKQIISLKLALHTENDSIEADVEEGIPIELK